MAKYARLLPTCHDPAPCFAKSGSYCTALRETYPYGTRCPFRKTYIDNLVIDGEEVSPHVEDEAEPEPERDFWEAFRYCSER